MCRADLDRQQDRDFFAEFKVFNMPVNVSNDTLTEGLNVLLDGDNVFEGEVKHESTGRYRATRFGVPGNAFKVRES